MGAFDRMLNYSEMLTYYTSVVYENVDNFKPLTVTINKSLPKSDLVMSK